MTNKQTTAGMQTARQNALTAIFAKQPEEMSFRIFKAKTGTNDEHTRKDARAQKGIRAKLYN
jgi:hypothetical protein